MTNRPRNEREARRLAAHIEEEVKEVELLAQGLGVSDDRQIRSKIIDIRRALHNGDLASATELNNELPRLVANRTSAARKKK